MTQILQQKFHDPDVVAEKLPPRSLQLTNELPRRPWQITDDGKNRAVRRLISTQNRHNGTGRCDPCSTWPYWQGLVSSRAVGVRNWPPGSQAITFLIQDGSVMRYCTLMSTASIWIWTFAVIGFSIFLSYADIIFPAVKDGTKRCWVVWLAIKTMSRSLMRKIRGWGFMFEWFRKQYGPEWLPWVNRSVSGESNQPSQYLNSGIQLILRSPLAFSLFRRQSNIHVGGYIDDEEMPSASINLAQLTT